MSHQHPQPSPSRPHRKFACVAILHDGRRIEHTVVAHSHADAELDFADALPGLPAYLNVTDTGPVRGNVIRIATGLHRAVPMFQATVSTSDLSEPDQCLPLHIPHRPVRAPHPLVGLIGRVWGTASNVAELYRFHRRGHCGRLRALRRAVAPAWHDLADPVA